MTEQKQPQNFLISNTTSWNIEALRIFKNVWRIFFLLILEDFLNDDLISLDEYGSSLEYIIKQDHTRAHLMIHDLFNHFFCLLLSGAFFMSSTFLFKQNIFKAIEKNFYWYRSIDNKLVKFLPSCDIFVIFSVSHSKSWWTNKNDNFWWYQGRLL